MNSASSSSKDLTNGLGFAEQEKPPSKEESFLSRMKRSEKLAGFVKTALKADLEKPIREITGTLSCLAVIVYVAGYTAGHSFYKLNKKIINHVKTYWPL